MDLTIMAWKERKIKSMANKELHFFQWQGRNNYNSQWKIRNSLSLSL
jgi:hypothetical protein